MTKETFAEKPGLQVFLEESISILGAEKVLSSDPALVRVLLNSWRSGMGLGVATRQFSQALEAREGSSFADLLADARNGLANHAYATEQKVRVISEGITEHMLHDGPVKGLLNVSYSAQGLFRLKGLLDVYRNYAALLDIMYDSTMSAEMALAVVKEDAVLRLAEMPEALPNDESAGAVEGLKNVIRIVTNTL